MQQVSDYELELMKIIWANGGTALYAEIVKALEDKGTPWTKNTIITLLSRLTDKGFLETQKTGFRNNYISIVSEMDYQEAQRGLYLLLFKRIYFHPIIESNTLLLTALTKQKRLRFQIVRSKGMASAVSS